MCWATDVMGVRIQRPMRACVMLRNLAARGGSVKRAVPAVSCALLQFCVHGRSNLMGTKFTVYDSGLNPVKSTSGLEAGSLRQELAAICYVSRDPPPKRTFRTQCEASVCKRVWIEYRRRVWVAGTQRMWNDGR